jgi:5-formyltetrahydrofolate cyclo-ligase
MVDTNRKINELRRNCQQARAEIPEAKRNLASAKICETIIRSGYFRRSNRIGCYLPSDEEVDTWPIIERALTMGKQVSVPVLRKKGVMQFCNLDADSSLSTNQFGLLEPQGGEIVDPHRLDIVITPLVAFDSSGNRIGMGGGYFDRHFAFLATRRIWLRPKLIGVAFDCQRVSTIVPNPWDIGLFRVVTETN